MPAAAPPDAAPLGRMPEAAPADSAPSRDEASLDRPPSRRVLDMRVDGIEAPDAVQRIVEWAAQSGPGKAGRYICAANVHMTMEAHDHPDFAAIVNDADLVLADGVPMVWALRALGLPQRRRVRMAPDLLYGLFEACETRGISVGPVRRQPRDATSLHRLDWPQLSIVEARLRDRPALPAARARRGREVRAPHRRERRAAPAHRHRLSQAGAMDGRTRGPERQRSWPRGDEERRPADPARLHDARRRRRLRHARWTHQGCARWMRDRGLEWVYRLVSEPSRLWHRSSSRIRASSRTSRFSCCGTARAERHRVVPATALDVTRMAGVTLAPRATMTLR